ncbi:hypothetical protein A4H34_03220 [Peptidiphaga gingivicola]|uniref:Uncharacterized protein n=1 Tax=Peptidiphaga gingivicola TaxID=2741497 RepID=A0A179B3C4_9ACTO|nr:hypothetical protein A4H34_03220 [Peptidiphaga gingivicola]
MRLKKLSVFLSIPALALSLASCGSDSKGESKETSGGGKTATASTNRPSADPSSATGSSSASQSDDSSSADSNSGNEGSGNNAQKPSKEAAVAGMSKMVKELPQLKNLKVPEQVLQNLSTCIVDKIYDKATPVTLNGLATGRTTAPLSRSDSALIKSSTLQCVNQLKQQMGGGAGNQ